MIKCPDCGKMISEHAEYCIECGCAMSYILKYNKESNGNYDEYEPNNEGKYKVKIMTKKTNLKANMEKQM